MLGSRAFGCAIALAILAPPAAHTQSATPPGRRSGILIVAHGGGPDWNRQVAEVAADVRHAGPVSYSFLMGPGAGEHPFQREVASLRAAGASKVVVVPLFMSSHSEHFDQLRWLIGDRERLDSTMMHHLHMGGIERPATLDGLLLASALDSSPELATALAQRARALAPAPAGRALLVVGHGPNGAEDYARWMAALRPVTEQVRASVGFRFASVELVRDDAPPLVRAEAVRRVRELVTLLHEVTGQPVVVVPALVATGAVSRVTLPRDLKGLPVVYTGDAVLPNPTMSRWVERRVAEVLGAH